MEEGVKAKKGYSIWSLLVIMIGTYFCGYAWYSLRLDSKDAIIPRAGVAETAEANNQ